MHEKVLKPLNDLLKLLEIPNKLITKRRDKLLDFECARSNSEKPREKNSLKQVQDNLYEAQKNYEALNNQLLEELPILIDKSSMIFERCFILYLIALKNIHESIRQQLSNLMNIVSFIFFSFLLLCFLFVKQKKFFKHSRTTKHSSSKRTSKPSCTT